MGAGSLTAAGLSWLRGFARHLHQPVDAASLGAFRIMFGLIVLYEVARTVLLGRVEAYFIHPRFHFTYLGFEWVRPLPPARLYDYFGLLAVCGVLVACGLGYRLAAVLVFLGISYYFLLEQALYLNHMYLFCLVAFLMCLVGANRWGSLDRAIMGWREARVPYWHLFLLRAQLFLVYFYAAIAKMNPDWIRGEPVRMWLHQRAGLPVVGPLLTLEPTVYFIAWGGLLFDLSIGFLLAWRRTRVLGLLGALFFHSTNKMLFNIGIFPEFAFAMTLLFCEPDWPRKLQAGAARLRERFFPAGAEGQERRPPDWDEEDHVPGEDAVREDEPPAAPPPPAWKVQPWGPPFVAAWLAVQALLPLRHWLYPGDVNWTEEGHRFSWRMKLRDKEGRLLIRVRDADTGREWAVRPEAHLDSFQIPDVSTRPDMTQQFARYLRDYYRARGIRSPEVYCRAICRLNDSAEGELVDPRVNLAEVPRDVWPKAWILKQRPPRAISDPYAPGRDSAGANPE